MNSFNFLWNLKNYHSKLKILVWFIAGNKLLNKDFYVINSKITYHPPDVTPENTKIMTSFHTSLLQAFVKDYLGSSENYWYANV